MLDNIQFKDDNYKEINISIDNESTTLQVKEIDRLQTYINLNKSIDTALYENIEIDGFLYYHPYDEEIVHNNDTLENGVVKEANNIDNRERAYIKGTIDVTISNSENTVQYNNRLKINNGIIKLSIPNTFTIGQYILEIKFLGNQFYDESSYQSIFNIKKRPIKCIFEYNKYYADAGRVIQIPARLVDNLNNKAINYSIQYVFNNNVHDVNADDSGNLIINALVPNPDISHCNMSVPNIQYNDTEYVDEDGNLQPLPVVDIQSDIIEDYDTGYHTSSNQASNQVIYPLTVFLTNNDTYELLETTILIIVNKVETETVINDFALNTENNQAFNISGYIKTDSQIPYASYGLIDIDFVKNNYQSKNISIDETGHFTKQILMSDIENVAVNSEYENTYNAVTNNVDTYIDVSDTSIEIAVEDFIEIIAHVRGNGNSIINTGMLIFSLYRDDDEKYRYVSELDNSGTATFNFLTTRAGSYIVKIKYYDGILGYKESEIEVQVEVDE